MQGIRRFLRETEWSISLADYARSAVGGSVMAALISWLRELSLFWGTVVTIGAGVVTGLVIFSFSLWRQYRGWKLDRPEDVMVKEVPESREYSEFKKQKDELEKRLSTVSSEYDSYKKDTEDRKKKELDGLNTLLATVEERARLLEDQCDGYKQLADENKQLSEDREKELSGLRGAYEALRERYGKAILWVSGRTFESRNLSVAVQHVNIDDVELAKIIRGLLASQLQVGSMANENYEVKHILLPFSNPSSDARIVIFSDDEVGGSVKDAFNGYNLIDEKVARFDRSFADGNVPNVDIAVIVFPERTK